MPRTKNFPPKKEKKGKHAQQAPETADEYLAAGVDLEEAGEKWRGGDAAKSTRFFVRAVECYGEALKKFPASFDLAYNKARVQYELTQHPKLLAQLPGSLFELLRVSLESSRYALKLNQDNADVLFNTAQNLTSIVEAINDSSHDPTDSFPLLEEALTLFERCFTMQEQQYTESQAQAEAMAAELARQETSQPSEPSNAEASNAQDMEDRWATIIEPITSATLIDTILASLQTLTLLLNVLPDDSSHLLPWIQTTSSTLLNTKLPIYQSSDSSNNTNDSALTIATFNTALATALFRSQPRTIQSLQDYTTAITDIASALPQSTPETLVAKAEAYITYHDALRTTHNVDTIYTLPLRWQTLFTALEILTEATKKHNAENLAKIHLTRGDVEMLRWQLGQEGHEFDAARKAAKTLLGNAEKFYRGAGKVAEVEGDRNVLVEAGVKEGVVKLLEGGEERAFLEEKEVMGVLEDAVEEGVFTEGQLRALGVL